VISRFVNRLTRMRLFVVTGLALSVLLSATSLVAAAAPRPALTGTQLPFSDASLAVDPVGQHVFAAGGPGNSSIVVLDFNGNVVTTITGEQGASGMALDPASHTLYVALADANAISEIDTTTLTETARFSTGTFTSPYRPVIAGGKLWIASDGGLATANLDGTGLASAPLPAGVGLPDFSKSVPAASADGNLLAVVAPFQSLTEVGVFDVAMKAPNLVSFAWDPNTGANASDLAFGPSGENVLMAAAAPYYVQPLDTRTLQSTGTYQTGPYPDAVAASPGGKYVAGAVWNPYSPNFYLYRSGDPTPIQSWTLPNYRPNPYGLPSSRVFSPLAFSPDGTELFAVAGGEFYVLPTPDGADTTVSLTSAPSDETFATAASFDFSSPDNSVTFECSLDGAPAQPCTSPASYTALAAGLHTFEVQAVDANGVEGSTGQTWMVEALDTAVFGGPQTKYSTTASFSFSSHDDNATFECNLDSSGWTPCTSPATYTQLGFGAHSFDVHAVDGNLVDQTGAGQTWTIKPPDTMLNGEPPPSTYTTNAAFSFWSHAPSATFQCSLDGSDWATCTAPASYTGLALGTHIFEARAVNDAGAADPVGVTYTWTINPPDTFLSSTPADPSYSTAAAFSFLSHAPNATFQCSLDGASWTACASPTSYQGLALGTHTFDVRAVDALATDPFGSSYTWTITQQASVVINGGTYATNTRTIRLHVVWPSSAHHVQISNDPSFDTLGGTETLPVAATIPWMLAPGSAPPTRTVYLRFPDSTTPSATVSDQIVLDTSRPVIQKASLIKPAPTTAGVYSLRVHATDKPSGISQVALSSTKSAGTIVVLTNSTQPGVATLDRRITAQLPKRPKWIRVRSAAGAWSAWHPIS
jgi:hypothetical protein